MAMEPLKESPTLKRAIQIERLGKVNPAHFDARFVHGEGTPAVVTDAMDGWKATSRWTFEFFKDRYGDDQIIANSPFFLEHLEGLSPVQVKFKLRDYLEYVEKPHTRARGEFLQGSPRQLKANGIPLYAPCYRVLGLHPELYKDLTPSPYFVEDLLVHFPDSFIEFLDRHLQPVHFLFFTPRGSKAFLHQDYWGTHAYLAQLKGRKLAVLFSPRDSDRIYRGNVRDPLWVDERKFPLFGGATPYVAVLEPTDTLFIPSMWWHYVLCLEPSITFSRDFVGLSNCKLYLTCYLETMLKLAATVPETKPQLFYETFAGLYRAAKAEREEITAQLCSPEARM